MLMLESVIVALSLFLAYVYAGYPLAVWFISRRTAFQPCLGSGEEPAPQRVVMVITAHNEEQFIAKKLDNALSLDALSSFDIVVASDGSKDRTNEIVRNYSSCSERVRLIEFPRRRGKTAALMDTIDRLRSHFDLVLFSDANALWQQDAAARLLEPFADNSVGVVTGRLRYSGGRVRDEQRYRSFEDRLRSLEGRLGTCIGAEGSIFAARMHCIPLIDHSLIEDFLIPLHAIDSGFRCVYQPSAISDEELPLGWAQAVRRRSRIVNRSLRALWSVRSLWLSPRRIRISWMIWSHKLLRWFSPFALLGLGLCTSTWVFQVAPNARPTILLSLAILGIIVVVLERQSGNIVTHFVGANLGMLAGVLSVLLGTRRISWEPVRSQSARRE